MNKAELTALEELSKNPNINCKQDKGGAVVVWDTKKYLEEANRQLDRDPK